MDLPFVRCNEEVDYESWLSLIVAAHPESKDGSFPTRLSVVVGFPFPYEQLYFNSNWVHWVNVADHQHRNSFGERRRYMSSWHSVELFALAPIAGSDYYSQISANWQEEVG